MKRSKKFLFGILLILFVFTSFSLSADGANGVSIHSKNDIIAHLKTSAKVTDPVTYLKEPVKNTQVGELSQATKRSALDYLNNIRYIAGLEPVGINDSYMRMAQAGAFVMWSTGVFDHYPQNQTSKPAAMSQEDWNLGIRGTGNSNISYGSTTLNDSIQGCVEDLGSNNLPKVGHRMWLLNPDLGNVGFGATGKAGDSYSEKYYATYVMDRTGSGTQDSVKWPARYMPIEYFDNTVPWSYATGDPSITNISNVTVTLTRRSESPSGYGSWTFSTGKTYTVTSSGEYFNVQDNLYSIRGQRGPYVIFRPADITYKIGDTFDVKITGLGSSAINYSVEFFSGYPVESISFKNPYTIRFDPDYANVAYASVAVAPNLSEGYEVIWSTKDTSIATVDGNGKITALKPGVTTVTAMVPGEYTIDGKDKYATTEVIVARSLDDAKVEVVPQYLEYTGEEIKPIPKVTIEIDGKTVTLEYEKDFIISRYHRNIEPTYKDYYWSMVYIEGVNKYHGYRYGTFGISRADISTADKKIVVNGLSDVTYTGNAHNPKISVSITLGGKKRELIEGTDYNYKVTNNINAGTATVTITGINDFMGTVNKTFKINPVDLSASASGTEVGGISNKNYTGSAITHAITVKTKVNGALKTLTEGTDYTVSYSNNTNAGTATVSITGKGNYSGTVKKTFTINKIDISKAEVGTNVTGVKDKTYTGSAQSQAPTVTAKVNGKTVTLKKDTEYTLTYKNNTNAGTATMTVTGKGNFTGVQEKTFKINPAAIKDTEITGVSNKTYTGSAQTQNPTVKFNGKTLTSGTDYTLSYKNNTNAGTATVTVTGKGNFTGTTDKTFTISQVDISSSSVGTEVTGLKDKTYTGSAHTQEPTVTAKVNGKTVTLKKDTDYTIAYKNNTNAGTATMTVTGKGNYKGVQTKTFKINPVDLSASASGTEVGGISNKDYTGSAITHAITVKTKVNGALKTLTEGTDYTVSYSNNVNAGTATVSITGKGNYSGTVKKTFTINKIDISKKAVATEVTGLKDKTYTGSAQTQAPTVTAKVNGKNVTLKKDTEYTIAYKNNTNTGTATMTVTGKGNYSGEVSKTFKINPVDLSASASETEVGGISNKDYTGSAITHAITVKTKVNGKQKALTEGTDYTVSYSNNVNAGTATVSITGKGNYSGTVKKTFTINKIDISKKAVATEVTGLKDKTYTGSAHTQEPTVTAKVNGKTVTLKKDTDYTIAYKNNTNAGTATMTVTGKGNYSGEVSKTFKINQLDIGSITWKGVEKSYVDTGKEIKPEPEVSIKLSGKDTMLKSGTDYTLSYKSNIEPGTGTITVKGKGNYKGLKEITFEIKHNIVQVKAKAATCTEEGAEAHYMCTGCDRRYSDKNATEEITKESVVTKALGHKYGSWTKLNNTQHQRVCEHDKTHIEKKNHSWDKGKVTKKPTTVYEGEMTYTCTVCKATKKESIPILQVWKRLSGAKAYDTMEAIIDEGISEGKFKKGGTVIIATGADYYDALAAAGLAGRNGAPVILTKSKTLPNQTASVLKKLSPSKIYIAGGDAAVSEEVEKSIKSLTKVTPIRLKGDDAAGTSAALALAADNWSEDKTAIIATTKSFHDALAAAPLAYAKGYPILLASKQGTVIKDPVKNALKELGITNVIIVGGEAAVSKEVVSQLEEMGIRVKDRLEGTTAIETSAAIANWGIENGMNVNKMGVATSQDYYDALSGAALCGINNSVLVLEKKSPDKVPARTNTKFSTPYKDVIERGYVFGGDGAVTNVTWNALVKSLG